MVTATGPNRNFPNASAYQEVLQHPQLCFSHPELKGAVPELTKLRLPRPISGAFASVFSLTNAGSARRYAVKCFTRHVPDQEVRYGAISRQLAGLAPSALSQPWKMGFEYLPDGIQVGRERYPILKMEWVQGITLSAWLDQNHRDSAAVDSLSDRFADLAADLSGHGIAHGDLQHGNLLVADDGTLRLVDYDGMYVPALSGRGGTERGHRNYQSPARGSDDFDSQLDRFSAWVIYLALKAVAADSSLWPQLHEPQGEYLLLAEDDFKNPSASPRFPALLSHPDRIVRDLADQVRYLAWQPLDTLPPLVSPSTAPASAPQFSAPPSSTSGPLPGWMSGHLPPSTPASSAFQATPPSQFTGRRALDVLVAAFLPVTLALSGLLLLAGVVTSYSLASLATSVFFTRAARRSRTETRLLRQHFRALKHQRREAANPQKASAELQLERRRLDSSEARRKDQLADQQGALIRQQQRDVAASEKRKLKTWTELERKLSTVDGELQAALRSALEHERAGFVQKELQQSRISSARLPGIGEKLKAELASCGIRTAADFTGIRLRPTSSRGHNSMTAVIVRSNGHEVNVKGIGETKARTLAVWRQQQISSAQSRCIVQLPLSRSQAIKADFNRQRTRLADQRRMAEAEAAKQRNQAAQRLQDGQARLLAEAATATEHAAKKREEFARRAIRIQNSESELAAIEAAIAEARHIRRSLSYARYLRFALTGR